MGNHVWQYCSLGGVIRVKIASGEDIAHLGELDEKYWTVLSCPENGLAMDSHTLAYIDSDSDGKIRVAEVVSAAEWLCSCVKDKDLLLKGDSVLPLDSFDEGTALGQRLKKSARQILDNLGLKEENSISLAQASDSVAIFTGTRFNGDGVITPVTVGDDEELKSVLADCIAKVGSTPDRSGEQGVTAEIIDKFYAACSDYSAWQASAQKETSPYADKTPAAYEAFCALDSKVKDYFYRCKLLRYDQSAAAAVDVKVEKLEDLEACPLARPDASGVLPLKAVNPSWQAAVDKLLALVPAKDFSTKDGVSEAEWNALEARFAGYSSWLASKKGAEVESLGIDRVNGILKAGRRQDLLDMVEKDNALKEESDSIDEVKKLMYLYRDFGHFLQNYVIFSDFYDRPGRRAIFEAGRLFIDQRCCDLCIRVSDMAGHNDMAKLSGMFLIYCKCSSKRRAASMDIVAVMTSGDIDDLRPGKNGIFYDLDGNDWDATVTKIVDNPISIRNAFWSPYRKFWEFCVGLINKSAADKENKVIGQMQAKASTVTAAPAVPADGTAAAPKPAFDIAKFAGIFAAIGLALGYIGSFITQLAAGIARTPWWQLLVAIAVIMLLISGPSCFIAWSKLRKRNLGPVLNANGWAINSKVLVNIIFGGKLTTVARYPKLNISDPYLQKVPAWKKWFGWIIFILVALAVVYFVFIREKVAYVFF